LNAKLSTPFDEVPQVVGGPYEYGVPGAVHGIFGPAAPAEAKATPAGTHAQPPTE